MPHLHYFPPQASVLLSGPSEGTLGSAVTVTLRSIGLAADTPVALEWRSSEGGVTLLHGTIAGSETRMDLPLESLGTYRLACVSHPSNLLRIQTLPSAD